MSAQSSADSHAKFHDCDDDEGNAEPSEDIGKNAQHEDAKHDNELRTTVVFRNLPPSFTRTMLLSLLDEEGFAGLYDFIYLPIKMKRVATFGYAFINFTSQATAERFFEHFTGFNLWAVPHNRRAEVEWSKDRQGLEAQIEHYRHSPVMQLDVPDHMQAIVLKDGIRIPFPPPRPPQVDEVRGKAGSKSSSKASSKAGSKTSSSAPTKSASKSSCSSVGGETSSQDLQVFDRRGSASSGSAGRGASSSSGYLECKEVITAVRKNKKAARRLKNKLSSQESVEAVEEIGGRSV